ncbi:MAG: trypsin-like peptidase domain-containing protein [Anaerolineales bacterium]|nr:trypsin-like peptidase domain-containing protein [Anaerolineales bacterium]
MADNLSNAPVPEAHRWQKRWQRLRTGITKAIPFALTVLVSLLAFTIYSANTAGPDPLTENQIEDMVGLTLASATPPPAISSQVYQFILPSLVTIQTERVDEAGDNGFGVGSGVVINNAAAILTALHVVENAKTIEVFFADGTRSPATIIAEEPENDIAVLMPERSPTVFVPATIGSTGGMRIGDEVYAVGNPLGLTGSMSAGVVSGFNRSFTLENSNQHLDGLIQFDAAVNPGNSGGPLLNRSGQVVGIVTGLVNPTKQEVFIGIGFAVPINVAAGAAGGPPQ